jgi:hypothetical protein
VLQLYISPGNSMAAVHGGGWWTLFIWQAAKYIVKLQIL